MTASVAIVGAGPAGFYTAEALLNQGDDLQIDILERLPTPFGLIRAGVAPDHQSTKQVARRFEQTALRDRVHFYGNVEIGRTLTLEELRCAYDAVVLAVGADADRRLAIPGEHLPGVYGSALFVGWYNGHPDFRSLDPALDGQAAVIIGNGNVALDVARVLVKSAAEMASSDLPGHVTQRIADAAIADVFIVGRRGAADAKFSAAELREIGTLAACEVIIDPVELRETEAISDPRQRRLREKTLALFGDLAEQPPRGRGKRLHFRFGLSPVEIEGRTAVEAVRFERMQIANGRLLRSGQYERIPCGLVVAAIGYRTSPLAGAPFDSQKGCYANVDGRIAPSLYAVGWAKRGPVGVIGSNRPDGELCARQIRADLATGRAGGKSGRAGLERLLADRNIRFFCFADWLRIDALEVARATKPAPRQKLTTLGEMMALLIGGGSDAVLSEGRLAETADGR